MTKSALNCDYTTRNIISPLSLNQDCWLLICNLLSYKDILNLAKVSPAYKKYLENYVLPLKFTIFEISFANKYFMNFEDLRFFLESISLTVEYLYLLKLPDEHFELLQNYRFPCVTEMRVTLTRSLNCADMKALSHIFPNLRTLTPHGIYAGKTIGLFRNVENLTLTCANITEDDFRYILLALNLKILILDVFITVTPLKEEEQLKLSQIREITLNAHELCWISTYNANNPIIFRNLKVLIVTGSILGIKTMDTLFRNIGRIVPRNVYEMEVANVEEEFLCKLMDSGKYDFLNRVHTLKFINVNILLNVFGISNRFKGLMELYFSHCHAAMDEDIALEIMNNSEELSFLSFEHCKIRPQRTHLKDLKARKKPITLNWYSRCSEKKLQQNCKDKYEALIKFTNREAYGYSNFDSMTIKFR